MDEEGDPLSVGAVPRFIRYGEKLGERHDWLLNVEHLAERCRNKGWRIEPHAHPGFGQLLFVRSGRGVFFVEEEQHSFFSPCVIIIPKHAVHGFQYDSDCDGWILTIDDAYLSQTLHKLPEFSWLWSEARLIEHDKKSDLWSDIHRHLRALDREVERQGLGHVLAVEVALTSLFLCLVRAQSESRGDGVNVSSARVIDRFTDLVERHFRQNWKVKDFSDVLGVSVVQLRQSCIASTGKGPMKLIHDRMITEAKRELLFGDLTVEQISAWLGISSPAYFTRFFKKETGQSPSQFRSESRSART
ncbi:MAG: helix-turn-helix domain-containing protein [Caulobacterales bacterium]|nr:helix-turn-helix domain-containing protein [Caulobacterales bacterium]